MVAYAILGVLILAIGIPAFWFLRPPVAFAVAAALPPMVLQLGNCLHLGYLAPFG